MYIIRDDADTFVITWEITSCANDDPTSYIFGKMQILIYGKPCLDPLYDRHTLTSIFPYLHLPYKCYAERENGKNIYGVKVNTGKEFGEKEFNIQEYNNLTIQNLLIVDTGELDIQGLFLRLGYSGDEERLFYSLDFEKTFQEVRYPRGTIESVLAQLPTREELIKQAEKFLWETSQISD